MAEQDTFLVIDAFQGNQLKCWKCKGTGEKPRKKSQPIVVCSVCVGQGFINNKRNSQTHKPYRPFKIVGTVPGPRAKYNMYEEQMKPNEFEMLSSLAGHWCIYQLEHGHRMTTDDVCCAAIAIEHMNQLEKPKVHLDIGTGLGSVLNMIHWAYFDTIEKSIGIEAQSIHVALAKRTIEFNGITEKCEIRHHDIRDITEEFKLEKVDLITGTPPYFPPPNGSLSINENRSMCSFELRGGIEVYCRIASLFLKPTGRFVVAQTSIEIKRTIQAGIQFGLQLLERFDFIGRHGKPKLFSVFVFQLQKDKVEPKITSIDIRDAKGQFTSEYNRLMKLVGKPPSKFEKDTVPSSKGTITEQS